MSIRNLTCKAALLSLLLAGNTCGDGVVQNPHFELWCGETICGWTVDQGEIQRTSTWHESDFGVSLQGEVVRLSQLNEVDKPTCLKFDLLSSFGSGVEMYVEMDFDDNGTTEYSQPIAQGQWQRSVYTVTAPTWYENVRFIVRKLGDGPAVIARSQVRASHDCLGAPLNSTDRPLGAECEDAAQCAAGHCYANSGFAARTLSSGTTCGECSDNSDCPSGQICSGNTPWRSGVSSGCSEPGSKGLGNRCTTNAE
jgi:Cys-rich repeat protein